jgi:hypothetical protein
MKDAQILARLRCSCLLLLKHRLQKPVWPQWAAGDLSGGRDIEIYKSPRGRFLYLPPFVIQNWAVQCLRCSTISALNCGHRLCLHV